MLLEFRAKNYKSFCDEMVFSMVPAQKQKGLDYSILSKKGGAKTYKGLCSSVVYGPNASGKTNIISAMDTFRAIVLLGHIRDNTINSPNHPSYDLALIPNAFNHECSPLTMNISFIVNNFLVDYTFTADLGGFFQANDSRKIISEKFNVNGELVFERTDGLLIGDLSVIEDFLPDVLRKHLDAAKSLSESALTDQELFLMNGFKSMFAPKFVERICDWLVRNFIVIYRAESHRIVKYSDKNERQYVYQPLNDALKSAFGLPNSFGYISEDQKPPTFVSVFEELGKCLPAEIFESFGTFRFATAIYPLIEGAILGGGTLVVDEFDASIHPMVLMNIIKIFHNDEINTKGAQLIFNTHNPIFLNSSLFRRDEIKFVERNEETNCSEVYSLSDFRTSGKYGVRKTDDYMKNYFVNRYGAIKDVDLSEHFLSIMEQDQEEVK